MPVEVKRVTPEKKQLGEGKVSKVNIFRTWQASLFLARVFVGSCYSSFVGACVCKE